MGNFSVSGMIAGLLYGIVGWVVFRKGKADVQIHLVVLGLLLMIYPYFTSAAWMDWGLGAVLTGLSYYSWNRDNLF